MKKQIFIAVVLLMGLFACKKDNFVPTPNQTSNEDVLKTHKPTIKIDEVKKWFDEQVKQTSSASSSADSSLFQTTPRWELAANEFSQVGVEFLVTPLSLKLRGGGAVESNLMVRRLPNGNFIGRYALYFPSTAYRNQVQGHYNPLDFTGSVIYTDLNGNYTHGFKLENGQVIGNATATKNDGRPTAGFRGCLTTTWCSVFIFPVTGEQCITVVDCSFTGGGANIPTPGSGGWNDGSGTGNGGGGSNGGSSSSGNGSSWGSNQPPVVLGQLTYEATQFLTSKGFGTAEMDYLSGFPDITKQIFDYLTSDGSTEAARFCRAHLKKCLENSQYKFANIQQKPALGTEGWANTLKFDDEPPTLQEVGLCLLHPIDAIAVSGNSDIAVVETTRRYLINGRDNISDAFRHAYWNALNASDMNVNVAKDFADAHESGVDLTVPAVALARTMDFWNNDQGRTIGANHPTASDAELSNLVFQAIGTGLMRYICNDVLIPTNQTC